MKTTNLKILSLAALLALGVAGCTTPTTPSASTSETPSSSQVESEQSSTSSEEETPSSSSEEEKPVEKGSWPAEIEAEIVAYLGESIPYIALEEETLYTWIADDASYMVIADCSLTNLISGYGEILEAEGWTFESTSEEWGYLETYYSKGDLVICYDYYPEEGLEGNEIFVWSEAEAPATEWDADLVSLMEDTLGEALPFVALDSTTLQYGVEEDEEGEFLYIVDASETNLIENYGETLLDNGYTFYATDTSYGYEIHVYFKGDIVIQFDFFPGSAEYYSGNEIYAWINSSESDEGYEPGVENGVVVSWPEDLASDMETYLGEQIPVAPFEAATFDYVYWVEDGSFEGFIADASATSFMEEYTQILLDAGYECLDEGFMGDYLLAFMKDNIYIEVGYFPGDDQYVAGNELWIIAETL